MIVVDAPAEAAARTYSARRIVLPVFRPDSGPQGNWDITLSGEEAPYISAFEKDGLGHKAGIKESDVHEIDALFKEFDKDSSGNLEIPELKVAFKRAMLAAGEVRAHADEITEQAARRFCGGCTLQCRAAACGTCSWRELRNLAPTLCL